MYEPIVKEKPKSHKIFSPKIHKCIFIITLAVGVSAIVSESYRSKKPEVQKQQEKLAAEFEQRRIMGYWRQPMFNNIRQIVNEREQKREAGELPEPLVSNIED